MNILFLDIQPVRPNHGGIERVSFILAKNFQKMGHKVIFLSASDNDWKDDKHDTRQFYISPYDTNTDQEFESFIKNYKIDVIINQHLGASTLKLLRNLKNKPKIFTVLHNRPFPISELGSKYKQLTHPITLKGRILKIIGTWAPSFYIKKTEIYYCNMLMNFADVSDQLIMLSHLYVDRVLKFIPNFVDAKIDAIYNPNTFNLPEENNPDLKNEERENSVLFLGRMEDPQKNVTGFIDVWNLFHNIHPDWKAYIVGDGTHKKYFENYAEKKKTKNLFFLGNRKDVDFFYSKSKIFCMTSLYEGWPMVLAEAMAYGCVPVVYDTFEAVHEIIDNNKTGVIIPPFDAKKMVDVLSEIADNDSLREDMAQKGRKHIRKFDSAIIIDIWEQKIKDLFKENNKS